MLRAITCLVFATLALSAQDSSTSNHSNHSLSGKVSDPSGGAVPAASVRLYSRTTDIQRTAQSGAGGDFRFDNLPAGEYLVEARTQGLDQASPIAVRVPSPGGVDLKLDVERLSTRVLVTATATPVSTQEAGKAMDVIDGQELDRRAEITFSDAVRLTPGVRVQQLGSPGTFTRILMRGLRAYDTSVTIDGFRLRDAASVQADATAYLGDLLVVNSDRIEVLRGSGSSMYGSNAIGGVINVVTDQGGGPLRGEISAEGGGLGLFRGLARMSGGAKENRFQYSGGVARLDVNGGIDGIESVANTSAQGFAQWRPTASTALGVRVMGTQAGVGITSNPQAAPIGNLPAGNSVVPAIALAPDQIRRLERGQPVNWGNATYAPNLADPDSRRDSNFYSSMVSWTQQLTPRVNYRVAWNRFNSNRDNVNGPLGVGYQSPYLSSNFYGGRYDTLQARADFAIARTHLLSAGYEWEQEDYDNHARDWNPDPASRTDARSRIRQRSSAVFVQDQARFFSDRLLLNLSGRIQSFDLQRPTFEGGAPKYEGVKLASPANAYTGDASLAYLIPSSNTKLRAHVGNGYRAPSLYERFGTSFFFGQFSPYGDPRLRPERTIAVDFGVDQYFAGDRYRVGVTYFYTRLQEIIGFGSTPNDPFGRFGGYVNTGGGLARGVELTAEARPWRSFVARGSYTYTNADERQSILTDGSVRGIRVLPHALTLVATQQITRRLNVTADFLAGSEYLSGTFFVGTGTRPYLFEGPRKLDASVNYTLPVGERVNLRFFTRIENLLNQRYFEDGFRTPKMWAVGGMKVLF